MSAAEGQDDGRLARPELPPLRGHGIIAGFGLAGRATANALIARGIDICVIERNPDTVRRCSTAGLRIYLGDATDEAMMRRAGIEQAAFFAATMPNDHGVIEAVALARRLNPTVRILARCEYVSTGMKATRRGADEVVIAEQVVAAEFGRLVTAAEAPPEPPPAPPAPPPAALASPPTPLAPPTTPLGRPPAPLAPPHEPGEPATPSPSSAAPVGTDSL